MKTIYFNIPQGIILEVSYHSHEKVEKENSSNINDNTNHNSNCSQLLAPTEY